MRSTYFSLTITGLVLASLVTTANAQLISVGIKGGVPVTDAVEGGVGVNSEARPYTVGPMAQISLPFSFAVEVDALYKRTGYSTFASGPGNAGTTTHVRANSWEFPILLKYYLPGYRLPVRPYAEIGYVPRYISGVQANILNFPLGNNSSINSGLILRNDVTNGLALGGGVELKASRLRIAPEVRYTHWADQPFRTIAARGFVVRSVDNQFEFLLGIRF